MANKLLKSITFPDLTDKYIIGDTTLSVAGAAADSKATGDALATKANVDGAYESMTVGNAEQLVSTVRANDKTPYLFRTSGGSVDIGDREYIKGIVGGDVAWNQQSKIFASGNWAALAHTTVTYSDGVATFLADAQYAKLVQTPKVVNGHKYFVSCDIKAYSGASLMFGIGTATTISNQGVRKYITATDDAWHNYYVIGTLTTGTDDKHLFQDMTASGWQTIQLKNFMSFDLTAMFGSTIADYIYSLEQGTAGAGVAWLKKHGFCTKPYYAYDAGALKSVSGLVSHDTTGFNQLISSENTTNTSGYSVALKGNLGNPIIGGVNYCISFDVTNVPSGGRSVYVNEYLGKADNGTSNVYINITANGHYSAVFKALDVEKSESYALLKYGGNTSQPLQFSNVCLNISWDGSRNGEYEPYVKHSYPLDSDLVLHGIPKLDANNNLYYDGDVYEADGTVTRRYGVVDMGTLDWKYASAQQVFYVNGFSASSFGITNNYNYKCKNYVSVKTSTALNETDKSIYIFNTSFNIHDSAYTDAPTFKSALSGNYLVYELATPTTESADPYQTPQICDDFGTEQFVLSDSVFAMPVGHDTDYPVNLKAKLEMAPDSPSQGNGDYIVRQTDGVNVYVPMVIEDQLPTIPSTAGTYSLKVTVADGSDPVLSWEA